MSGFRELEGDVAVYAHKGVYNQGPLYEMGGALFVKVGGGFVRVYRDGSTSKTGTKLIALHTEADLWVDAFNRLAVASGPRRKPVQLGAPTEGALQIEDKT